MDETHPRDRRERYRRRSVANGIAPMGPSLLPIGVDAVRAVAQERYRLDVTQKPDDLGRTTAWLLKALAPAVRLTQVREVIGNSPKPVATIAYLMLHRRVEPLPVEGKRHKVGIRLDEETVAHLDALAAWRGEVEGQEVSRTTVAAWVIDVCALGLLDSEYRQRLVHAPEPGVHAMRGMIAGYTRGMVITARQSLQEPWRETSGYMDLIADWIPDSPVDFVGNHGAPVVAKVIANDQAKAPALATTAL